MQNSTIKVNNLPSPTWNWLNMNSATVNDADFNDSCKEKSIVPKSIEFSEKAKPQYDNFVGGLDKEFNELATKKSETVSRFVSKENNKENAKIKIDFFGEDEKKTINRLEFTAKKNSNMTVIMNFSSDEKSKGLMAVSTKAKAEENANLTIVQIQMLGQNYRMLSDVDVQCDDNSNVKIIEVIIGGSDTYLGCLGELNKPFAKFNVDTAYLMENESKLDMNYIARHIGKSTESLMTVNGVLSNKAQKLFRGTIDFRRGASGSVGNEKEDVLLLTDDIINKTIPLILCKEEDVVGNHGATIGKLDDDVIFYFESRGVPKKQVYSLMAKARIDSVCKKIDDKETKKTIEEYLNNKWGKGLGYDAETKD